MDRVPYEKLAISGPHLLHYISQACTLLELFR
jgi:hypothetical protein